MSQTQKRRTTKTKRLQLRMSQRRYHRAREAAIRAGFKTIQGYLRAVIRKLIDERGR